MLARADGRTGSVSFTSHGKAIATSTRFGGVRVADDEPLSLETPLVIQRDPCKMEGRLGVEKHPDSGM